MTTNCPGWRHKHQKRCKHTNTSPHSILHYWMRKSLANMPCMLNEDRTLKLSLRGNQKASYRAINHKLLKTSWQTHIKLRPLFDIFTIYIWWGWWVYIQLTSMSLLWSELFCFESNLQGSNIGHIIIARKAFFLDIIWIIQCNFEWPQVVLLLFCNGILPLNVPIFFVFVPWSFQLKLLNVIKSWKGDCWLNWESNEK